MKHSTLNRRWLTLALLLVLTAGLNTASAFTINVKNVNGISTTVDVQSTDFIWTIKKQYEEKTGCPVFCQILTYQGKILKDELTVGYYGIESDETLHALMKLEHATQGIRITFNDGTPTAYILLGSEPAITHDGNGNITLDAGTISQTYDQAKVTVLEHQMSVGKQYSVTAKEDPTETGSFYATFYSSQWPYLVPDGVTAYTATEEDALLTMHKRADGIIPAGEGVVLKSTIGSYTLTACDGVKGVSENALTGSDMPVATAPSNCYILSGTAANGVGFYPWTGQLTANKAYLVSSASNGAASLRFDFGNDTDGIDTKQAEPDDAPIYNLQGMRVDDQYKGIVIVNGKKMLKQ